MAKFRVGQLRTEAHVIRRTQVRGKNDLVRIVEQEQLVTIKPGAYGHENLTKGDVIEITDSHLITKARSNPTFSEVKEAGVKASAPNCTAGLTHERLSDEWLQQRAQFRGR